MNTQHHISWFVEIARLAISLMILSGCILGRVFFDSRSQTKTTVPTEEQLVPANPAVPTYKQPTSESPNPVATLESSTSDRMKLTKFGLLTVLPESSGSSFSPQVIQATTTTGALYMRVALDWAISESQQGQLTFNSRNDETIQNIEQAGLRVFPTIYVGRGWMNNDPPGRQEGGSRSYPPLDLGTTWNERFGYSPTYYDFIYKFISHYKGHFDYVVIENEANSRLFWGGTANDYVRLLKTAYLAIKAADSQVIVSDSGFVSTAIGACIMSEYLKTGQKTPDQILEFAGYYQDARGGTEVSSIQQLQKILGRPKVQEQCDRINYMLDHMANTVDVVNFHFYEDYRALPTVVEWLRIRTSTVGYNPGIISNELGTRSQSTDFAENPAYAKEVFQKMLTSISLNLQVTIYFSADTVQSGKDKVGLFDNNGQLRPAGNSFKLVINTLDNKYQFKEKSSSGLGIYRYIFEDANGVPSLEAVWFEGNEQFIKIDAPTGFQQASIIDNLGEIVTVSVKNSQIELPFGNTSFFIKWEQ